MQRFSSAEISGVGFTSKRTRARLVSLLAEQGIYNQTVLNIVQESPRHLFVDSAFASRAYENTPLPIGYGQTISQPFIVSYMTQYLLENSSTEKILEIGTGCGYQAYVLSKCFDEVHSIERLAPLYKKAVITLDKLAVNNVQCYLGDGLKGLQEQMPFDAIIATCAASEISDELLCQLSPTGICIAPVGEGNKLQQLMAWHNEKAAWQKLLEVRFVPMIAGVSS